MVTDRVEREIVVAAPAERLWEVLTRPEHIGRWFEGMDVEVDLRPGGAMVLTSQEFGKFHAVVDKVEPPRLFAYRWARHPDTPVTEGSATRVEFTLAPQGNGTRLRVAESGFTSTDAVKVDQQRHAEANSQGWVQVLDRLRRYAEQRTA
ncbi:MAG TPA: SRPBCC family protein [Actinomycetes bacterium]|jgi:uncharacterized protein YndB with AHSA1/START domain|nr:SRPBCC family protein [Actinomycetes bacterium]